ncbi:hypothetical protein KVG29_04975 [Caldicoprobacter algeriensis]|uniref:dATP/dGTP diphosphohydrolase domain-containing protein n=1 Tax=Caldicoprobacter algeriensis TaxID=699281 RepID=UPI0020798AEE|nr:dATP/dGTP diphosphohydrolase domain-containing protein [Caldicoprobacter algeriensis]MCM8900580.1 hypothetical protein [Caldicoprobacter algeriensis]
MLKDSGVRRVFETGAVRDIAEGKGRCDLLPLDAVAELIQSKVLPHINDYVRTGKIDCLERAILAFIYEHPAWDLYTALLEVSKQYEEGARKYEERNWEKGIPLHCYIDSGVRHYLKWRRGDKDEPHDRAFIWNMLGCIWTHKNKRGNPELFDLPFSGKEDE